MVQIQEVDIPIDLKDAQKYLKKIKRAEETKIVFLGSTQLSGYILEKLNEKYEVQVVITQPDQLVGRKKEMTPTSVARVAEKLGLPLLKPERLNEEFIRDNLALLEADLYVLVAYGKIIPQAMLDIPRLGILNVHPSLLPKYRGASPIKTAILNGEESTGVTVMLLDEEMDHGPILARSSLEVARGETDESLSQKLAIEGAKLLLEVLPDIIKGQVKPQPQNHAEATYTKMIKKEDGYFEIDTPPPPEQLDRMIRAYYPWPNVWTRWSPFAKASGDRLGKIVKFYPEGRMQMEGKKIVSKEEFLRGYPDFPLKNLI